MVRHDHERTQFVVAKLHAFEQRLDHEVGDVRLAEEHGSGAGHVKTAIHPYEGLAGGQFAWGRLLRVSEAAVEVPGEEEPTVRGVDVGEPARVHV